MLRHFLQNQAHEVPPLAPLIMVFQDIIQVREVRRVSLLHRANERKHAVEQVVLHLLELDCLVYFNARVLGLEFLDLRL